ncbi:MAG: hemolysin family protein [Verrucomicrobiota bacterium JB022]|nr:hemolysin family protein [Verrucomicrobiota bacterium JB022]
MVAFILAIAFTLGTSAFCSLLEAFILSTTVAETETMKKEHPRRGRLLGHFKETIEESSASILTLNTIANTAGSIVVGALGTRIPVIADAQIWVVSGVWLLTAFMTVAILVFSEIIPKNIGVAYRRSLGPWLVDPLLAIRIFMKPFSFLARKLLSFVVVVPAPTEEEQEEEIRLLAERSAKMGALTDSERDLVSNALSLDDKRVEDIMTPRTVVMFLRATANVGEVMNDFRNIPFARIPVYEENIDDVIGIVRRRDILEAYGEDQEELTMRDLMRDAVFVPETASALDAMQLFLRKHQQIAVVVDEFGSTAGVISMEDIVEQLLGDEIYEHSDLAVDMRELAKKRAEKRPPATPDASSTEAERSNTSSMGSTARA